MANRVDIAVDKRGIMLIFFYFSMKTYEPVHDKTYKTSVTSKDSDQPVHPLSMARVLIYPYLDSLAAAEGSCIGKDSDAKSQADLSFCWMHKCRALACIH